MKLFFFVIICVFALTGIVRGKGHNLDRINQLRVVHL